MDTIGISKPEDAFQGLTGRMQQPPADHRPRHDRLLQRRVAERDDDAVGLREQTSGVHLLFLSLEHQQTRVRNGLSRYARPRPGFCRPHRRQQHCQPYNP